MSAIQATAEAIKNAQTIAVLTGAGVSKESGVPTFRDAQTGLWAQYDPQQLATPRAFRAEPKLVWDWYEWRRELAAKVKPNPGHVALAQLEAPAQQFVVITQNVDDLHEQGGSNDVIHLHGNIARSKCFDDCQGKPTIVKLDAIGYEPGQDERPPRCPHCTAYLRPDVVWFGEVLPEAAIRRAYDLSQQCDLMLVVGTAGMVTPAASLPRVAKQAGATIIEVNPDDSAITPYANIKISAPSGEALPQVLQALEN